jgi:hypothetical protein
MKRYQLGALLGIIGFMTSMSIHAYDGDYYYDTQPPRYYQQPSSGSITIPLGNTYNSPSITFSVPTYVRPPVVYEHHYYAPPVVYHRPYYYRGYTSYRSGEHRHHHGHYNSHHYDD